MELTSERASRHPEKRKSQPQNKVEEIFDIEDYIVYGETSFTADKKNAIVEEDTTPLGIYSAELGEGGKEQQDSLGVFTCENKSGDKETWMIVADGVSNSKDGAVASKKVIDILEEKLSKGIDIKKAVLQIIEEFSHEVQIALATQKAKGKGALGVDVVGAGAENPLLSSTLVAVKTKENGQATAYRLGDGQVYISRADNRKQVEKIQNGEMKPVDMKEEARIYMNPMERQLRQVAEGSMRGSIDLVQLYKEGKIDVRGKSEQLRGVLEKLKRGADFSSLSRGEQGIFENFSESPQSQADKLKEIPLGELKPGDVVLVCSDGIENNILCSDIYTTLKHVSQDFSTKDIDANKIRAVITNSIQKIMSGQVKRDYAKPDNFSLIVYVQTSKGLNRMEITDKDIDGLLDDLTPEERAA